MSKRRQKKKGVKNKALQSAIQLYQAGNLDAAQPMCDQALLADPQSVDANHLRGVIASLKDAPADAIRFFLVAVENGATNSGIHFNLGVCYSKLGNQAQALPHFQKSADLDPHSANTYFQWANACYALGDYTAAIPLYLKAIEKDPQNADLWGNLGGASLNLGRLGDAVTQLEKAISLEPDHVNSLFNLGRIHHQGGRLDEAIACHTRALKQAPGFVDALVDLADIYRKTGDLEKAATFYQNVLRRRPNFMQAHSNYGLVLRRAGKSQAALVCFEKANELDPNVAEVHANMGAIHADRGELVRARQCFNRAFEIDPGQSSILSNLIFIEDFDPHIDEAGQQASRKKWNELFVAPLADRIIDANNDRSPDRMLRIGYVSGDFKTHSACHGFASLIQDFDRQNFEVYCYDNNAQHDRQTVILQAAADHWRSVFEKSDEEVADLIRQDRIDILVDLSGHTSGNRLKVFGYKPAPLQVTGIGHSPPGLSTIDYRLTTGLSTPKDAEHLYPEMPVYLNCRIGYQPPHPSPDLGPLPMLANGYVTFGSFNRINKISDKIYPVWAKILHAVPDSQLLFKCKSMDDETLRAQTREKFRQLGVADDRLQLQGQTGQYAHLEAIANVDICLDPFPHGGGITTLDCLWMGVPVLGQITETKMVDRCNLVFGGPLGMADWATVSDDAYVQMAVQWASRPQDLNQLRKHLRSRFDESYFSFTKEVETAYRAIWRRWCAGEEASAWDIRSSDY